MAPQFGVLISTEYKTAVVTGIDPGPKIPLDDLWDHQTITIAIVCDGSRKSLDDSWPI
jgi:hypothetical protein